MHCNAITLIPCSFRKKEPHLAEPLEQGSQTQIKFSGRIKMKNVSLVEEKIAV